MQAQTRQPVPTPAAVRRVNVHADTITLFFRDDAALEAALPHILPELVQHPRTLINRTGGIPQLVLPIVAQ